MHEHSITTGTRVPDSPRMRKYCAPMIQRAREEHGVRDPLSVLASVGTVRGALASVDLRIFRDVDGHHNEQFATASVIVPMDDIRQAMETTEQLRATFKSEDQQSSSLIPNP